MKPPAINDAKKLAYDYRARAVLVLAFGGGQLGGASYGMTRADCTAYGHVLDKICDMIEGGEIELPDGMTPELIEDDIRDTMARIDGTVEHVIEEWETKGGDERRAWLIKVMGSLLMLDRNGQRELTPTSSAAHSPASAG